ncbi:sulfite exporter TauE/SafE family protein [Nodularia spumigena]|uniref:sulfite exporter TauE/SafE family protein n=1 Tax=Nodularia spumigena TaxID=70799 RepID=UPI002B1EF954|nr:sulfite exporter TauE/SafE family protein [Nodularia spumigena]MEA5556245.1 sulfite exporter TauE/SafE family protein [Nodularia spumigena CH309]
MAGDVLPLMIAVLSASLLGSMHCAGMCGAFLAVAIGPGDRPASPLVLQSAYHGGRLVTYTLLGAIAGAIGSAVDLAGEAAGLARSAAILAGVMMIWFGTVTLLRVAGVRVPRMPLPAWLQRTVGRGHRMVLSWPPFGRALSIGLLTTLLPCGWLYAFAITAAGTGDPGLGALTMSVFWMGTLPVLVTLGVGITRATGFLGRKAPLLTSIGLIGIGIFTVANRLTINAFERGETTADGSIERLSTLHEETPPCCEPVPTNDAASASSTPPNPPHAGESAQAPAVAAGGEP